MPDLSLPEIHLPDIKLPDGLRDMNRQDIQNAISDRMPKKIEMPDIDLSKVDLPKAVEDRLEQDREGHQQHRPAEGGREPDARPEAVEPDPADRGDPRDRLDVRRRLVADHVADRVGSKVRETADRIKARVTGQETALQRYDDDNDLGSLLPNPEQTRPSVENETWPDTFADSVRRSRRQRRDGHRQRLTRPAGSPGEPPPDAAVPHEPAASPCSRGAPARSSPASSGSTQGRRMPGRRRPAPPDGRPSTAQDRRLELRIRFSSPSTRRRISALPSSSWRFWASSRSASAAACSRVIRSRSAARLLASRISGAA